MLSPALSTSPRATGTTAPTVPIDVPVAKERNAEITNTPAVMYCAGITESPRLTVESTPPIALATAEKPPARRKIMSMHMMSRLPAPFAKISNFSSIVPLNMKNATIVAMNTATTEGN